VTNLAFPPVRALTRRRASLRARRAPRPVPRAHVCGRRGQAPHVPTHDREHVRLLRVLAPWRAPLSRSDRGPTRRARADADPPPARPGAELRACREPGAHRRSASGRPSL
jgi:hypothetical protein